MSVVYQSNCATCWHSYLAALSSFILALLRVDSDHPWTSASIFLLLSHLSPTDKEIFPSEDAARHVVHDRHDAQVDDDVGLLRLDVHSPFLRSLDA